MRKSKSDPAKYAKGYRKISQRQMTRYDHIDEEKEIERLRTVLRDSETHLERAKEDQDVLEKKSKRKRKEWKKDGGHDESKEQDTSMFSEELLAECGDDLVVLPNKKRPKKNLSSVSLTPEEIKEAKAMQKKTARKLQQLETRAAQKKQRVALYKKLEQHQISSTALDLLSRSGKLSRKDVDTKKQVLQKLVKRERAGIDLTENEKELLYPERLIDESEMEGENTALPKETGNTMALNTTKAKKVKVKAEGGQHFNRATKSSEPEVPSVAGPTHDESHDSSSDSSSDKETPDKNESLSASKSTEVPVSGIDFAAQMMASMSKLKQETAMRDKEESSDPLGVLHEDIAVEEEKRYTPAEPIQLKTAATLGLKVIKVDSRRKVFQIQRPEEVEAARYDLPVSAMEFEITDAIRNNDVTIVCGETGSGKSTQVPSMLFEAGLCVNEADPESSFVIGVTQPRRVAAVSTAKRVCYEMGCGDGQTIKSSGKRGNSVSYRTRYESAGSGSDTRIQFMTDGILLQEIQSDLLLRRYSVILLDEAHERNINTDVLIGLLSVALPLRKKAAEEDPSLVPLKLVLMSATLRVEDFTKNEKLFPTGPPAVVKVPGRTFPVTIHHSKSTELDDYESVAFRKICKIHRKLPHGGILVFLTGRGEIIRMVNKLRKALNRSSTKQARYTGTNDIIKSASEIDDIGPRELDDEELDAEVSQDDFDNIDEDEDVASIEYAQGDEDDDNIPKEAYILPMYSLLSTEEQAKVFAPVPEGHRLIVVATNICETSITIPNISYVVDPGRQKVRNYNSGTGVASYDVMWVSKAAADQRAGRAGRTGPGHCYRLYSSSVYSRHMDAFEMPEVLTRPLEDVVLAMKSLNISNVADFPFPTPPDTTQIDAAVKLLANIGCVDISNREVEGGDGIVTRLGKAVAKLPLGVRYAKMLLVAAQAGVLDYAIVVVSALSENSPFQHRAGDDDAEVGSDDESSMDEVDRNKAKEIKINEKKKRKRWYHERGDIFAAMLAVGAYTYAGKGAGGMSEKQATHRFCEENGLNSVIMDRIQKTRKHLAGLAKSRLRNAKGIAAKTGGYSSKMSPPNQLQERLLLQAITSGFLDNVALLAPPGSLSGEYPYGVRSAYLSSSSMSKDPLYIDSNSTMFSRDFRQLPKWICYDVVVRKLTKDGTPVKIMKNITPVDPTWLGELSKGSGMLSTGPPLPSPTPSYDVDQDAVLCSVSTRFGSHGWEIPPIKMVMYDCLQSPESKLHHDFLVDDSFRWFARFLLEGKVLPELKTLNLWLNDTPTIITRRTPSAKVSLLVSSLASNGVDSASALKKHWAEEDEKFLFKALKTWVQRDKHADAKKLWIYVVKKCVAEWKKDINV